MCGGEHLIWAGCRNRKVNTVRGKRRRSTRVRGKERKRRARGRKGARRIYIYISISGSTIVYAAERLAELVKEQKIKDIVCIPTSFQSIQLIKKGMWHLSFPSSPLHLAFLFLPLPSPLPLFPPPLLSSASTHKNFRKSGSQ